MKIDLTINTTTMLVVTLSCVACYRLGGKHMAKMVIKDIEEGTKRRKAERPTNYNSYNSTREDK